MNTQPELKNNKEVIVYLSKLFPKCFFIKENIKPLKIGIFKDLSVRLDNDEKLSKTKLRSALRAYTTNWGYLYSIKKDAKRIDIDGNECEIITIEQEEYAQSKLKLSKQKFKNNSKSKNSIEPPIVNNKKNKSPVINNKKVNDKTFNKKEVSLKELNDNHCKVGNIIRVKLGSKLLSATILNIEKGNIRVKIPTGIELTVKMEHIFA